MELLVGKAGLKSYSDIEDKANVNKTKLSLNSATIKILKPIRKTKNKGTLSF